jgi:hypothetical protein
VLRGIGFDLGAIGRNMVQPSQASLAAQRQHLHEQPRQGIEVAPPELADGAEIRLFQRGHRLEIEPLLARPRNPARRIDAAAIGIQQ